MHCLAAAHDRPNRWRARRVREVVAALCQNTQGSAALEFGFLAPLLLLMLLGTIELGRAIDMSRHFTSATAMVGDLVAREEWLGTSKSDAETNLDVMMKSIEHLMHPYDPSTLTLSIFSVRAASDDPDDTKVEWSYSYSGKDASDNARSAPEVCDRYTLTPGLLDAGGSTIVVESSYTFKPLFADFVPGITGNTLWTDKSFHSPRNSCVDYVKGDNCSSLDCD